MKSKKMFIRRQKNLVERCISGVNDVIASLFKALYFFEIKNKLTLFVTLSFIFIFLGISLNLYATDLNIKGSQFLINNKPTFLFQLNYYSALEASRYSIEQDLDDMQRLGINSIRIGIKCNTSGEDISVTDTMGNPIPQKMNKLRWILAECDRRGVIVGLAFPNTENFKVQQKAVSAVASELKVLQNWYVDFSMEPDNHGEVIPINQLQELRDIVKQKAPGLPFALSIDDGLSENEMRSLLLNVNIDFINLPGKFAEPSNSTKIIRQCMLWMKKFGREVPVNCQVSINHDLQKEFYPLASNMIIGLHESIKHGTAGWCVCLRGNGNELDGQSCAYSLAGQRLFDQLDTDVHHILSTLAPVIKTARSNERRKVRGTLKIHPGNPRYLSDGAGQPIYITGSHTWMNFQDIGSMSPLISPVFDYGQYLHSLETYHHNFIRLWAWEEAWRLIPSTLIHVTPSLFKRTGPGIGNDTLDKFDLTQFNPEYFKRLRQRIIAADNKGMYVGVMLFQGFSVAKKSAKSLFSPWDFHPFNKNNNINDIDGDLNQDGEGHEVHTLSDGNILAIQKAYVRKVIDELNDLDNIIYEISNESHAASTEWQYEIINYIHEYEKLKPKQHLVWMSYQWDGILGRGGNRTLFNSPSDIISPGRRTIDEKHDRIYESNPPVANGSKIIIADTDHINVRNLNRRGWVWQIFMRGNNPIYMDFLGNSKGEIDTRIAMGVTRQFADRINLSQMIPLADSTVCSTGYCLYKRGSEYLAYQPVDGPFTIDLLQGKYHFEWFDPIKNKLVETGSLEVKSSSQKFVPPLNGEAVLYLKIY